MGQIVPPEPAGETAAPPVTSPNAQPEGVPQAPPEGAPETPPGADAAPPQVEGPLFVVAPEGTPHGGGHGDAREVREIYRASDQTFVNVLWWWVLLVAVIAGLGYGAWMIWGRRTPRPPSGR